MRVLELYEYTLYSSFIISTRNIEHFNDLEFVLASFLRRLTAVSCNCRGGNIKVSAVEQDHRCFQLHIRLS